MKLCAFIGPQGKYNELHHHSGPVALSKTIRTDFGDITIDQSNWLAGDIFVSKPIDPGLNAAAISVANAAIQKSVKKNRWSHVAIYGADDLIWEAWPDNGVRGVTIREFFKDKQEIVRRRFNSPPDFRPLMDVIKDQIGAEYTRKVSATRRRRKDQTKLVCTTFVSYVLTNSVGVVPFEQNILTPKAFIDAMNFQTQPLKWLRIEEVTPPSTP